MVSRARAFPNKSSCLSTCVLPHACRACSIYKQCYCRHICYGSNGRSGRPMLLQGSSQRTGIYTSKYLTTHPESCLQSCSMMVEPQALVHGCQCPTDDLAHIVALLSPRRHEQLCCLHQRLASLILCCPLRQPDFASHVHHAEASTASNSNKLSSAV